MEQQQVLSINCYPCFPLSDWPLTSKRGHKSTILLSKILHSKSKRGIDFRPWCHLCPLYPFIPLFLHSWIWYFQTRFWFIWTVAYISSWWCQESKDLICIAWADGGKSIRWSFVLVTEVGQRPSCPIRHTLCALHNVLFVQFYMCKHLQHLPWWVGIKHGWSFVGTLSDFHSVEIFSLSPSEVGNLTWLWIRVHRPPLEIIPLNFPPAMVYSPNCFFLQQVH